MTVYCVKIHDQSTLIKSETMDGTYFGHFVSKLIADKKSMVVVFTDMVDNGHQVVNVAMKF